MRRKKRDFLESELTPLIDIVFLLLVFFMVTSVFKKDELKLSLSLPQSESGNTSKKEVKDIKISLSADKLLFNGKEIELNNLKTSLQKISDKALPVAFKADENVQYKKIIDVLDVLQSEEFFNLDLITERR